MYWVTVVVLLIYLVLVWFLPRWLPVPGSDVWILRGALAVLGLIGAGAAFWFQHKVKKAKETSGEDEPQRGGADDLDALVREAARQLKRSSLGRGSDLSTQPVVFVLGDSGSTKTTLLIHSALDPELLSGQVYRDDQVLPTASVNLWYTRQAVFVDPAGDLMSQRDRWKHLVKVLQPARFTVAFGKKTQAPRAAIVCFDCESFLQPGASETSLSVARRLSARLHEISQILGISFPVYVLFTKLDRVSFFTEFVRGMSKDEVAEVLGATLPLRSPGGGVYAEEETRRLSKGFDEIFYSLAERRIMLLPRENDSEKLPGIYEFPREFNKLRKLLVQFLVDLARPSQLGVNPFLRGFYFTGVRPTVVEDVVAAPAFAEAPTEETLDAGATQIFRGVGSQRAQAHAPGRNVGPRRLPQWVFLSGLFNDVLVKDRVALAASGSSSHVNVLRRIALGAAVLVALICLTGFTVSFFRNHALENRVQEDIAALKNVPNNAGQPASKEDLEKLDALRQELADLSDWETNGRPWSFRWGLYEGDEVYKYANPIYFQNFRRVLFNQTQDRIVHNLSQLDPKAATTAANGDYEKSYSELKEYLIASKPEDHEYSAPAVVSPVLLTNWVDSRTIDEDRQRLANLQFDYYSTERKKNSAFDVLNDSFAVGKARTYLLKFSGIDRYYVHLIAEASKGNPDRSFNDEFPDSRGIISSEYKVKGAFMRNGYGIAQEALKNPQTYMKCEEWVLGSCGQTMNEVETQQKLTGLYNLNFVKEWNKVLATSHVVAYAQYDDAARKLDKLSGSTSPLLELLYFVSHNVDRAPKDIKAPFAPVQAIQSPGPEDKLPDRYIDTPTDDYITKLSALQAAIQSIAGQSGAPDDDSVKRASNAAEDARTAASTTTKKAPVDSVFHNEAVVRQLLEEPIDKADSLLGRASADRAAGSGKSFCAQFDKYPLNARATQDMSLDDFNSVFGDSFKKLLDDTKSFVTKQGSIYVATSAKTSQQFVAFLNSMYRMKEALYPGGVANPSFPFTLKQLPSNVDVQLKIGNEAPMTGPGAQKRFVWSGGEEVQVLSKSGDMLENYSGAWGVFKFIARANQKESGRLEWSKQTNGVTDKLPNGKDWSYDYQLQVTTATNPFFELPGMKCVSKVAAGP